MGSHKRSYLERVRRLCAGALRGFCGLFTFAAPMPRPHARLADILELEDRRLLSAVPVGSEFLVNTFTAGPQQTSQPGPQQGSLQAVAVSPTGASVVVWQSQNEDGNGWGVFAQRFDSSGNPAGAEFRVNTTTQDDQQGPAVAMDAGGNFVVAWQSHNQDGSGWGVYAQRYNSAGVAKGGEFRVNTYTNGDQVAPSIAVSPTGAFVVSWASQNEDGNGWGVYAQRYDSSGNPAGAEFRVNTITQDDQLAPSVAMDAGGNFVIAWQSHNQDGSGWGVYAQRYDSAGVAQGGEFRVNTYTQDDQQSPSVAVDGGGNFVVAWQSHNQDGSGWGVYAQRFDASAVPQGGEFRVNSTTQDNQQNPVVAMAGGGNFVITWQSHNQDGGGWGVYAQSYNAAGTPLGGEFRVNTTTAGDQQFPSVAADSNGDLLVVWSGAGVGDGSGVFGQRFAAAGITVTPTSGLVTTMSGGTATFQVVLDTPPTANVSIGLSSSDTTEGMVSAPSLTFTPANWNVPQTVTVTGVNNVAVSGDQSYTIVTAPASSADGSYNGLNPVDVAVTNVDTHVPGFTVTPTAGLVTTEAGGTATFLVRLNTAPLILSSVTITFTSSDPTAGVVSTPPLNFTSLNWNVPQLVTITGVDDDVATADRTYTINGSASSLLALSYNGLPTPPVTVTNQETDVAGVVVTPTSGVTTEAGATATFQVQLTSKPTANVTVGLSSSNPGQGSPNVPSVTFTPANWNTPQTVTVIPVDDHLLNGDQTYTIVTAPATSTDPNYNGFDPADVQILNVESDGSPNTLIVTTAADLVDGNTSSIAALLANPGADGHISLREAIIASNNTPGVNRILFDIGSGVQTIHLAPSLHALPTITNPVVIDGTTQPGFSGMPLIELDGTKAGSGASGLTITAGNSTVTALAIANFSGTGIELDTNGNNLIAGNFIGTDPTGTVALGNASWSVWDAGVVVNGSANNTIGGLTSAARNVISGNISDGVDIEGAGATGNLVQGNYIGTDATGTQALGNAGNGVWIGLGAGDNTVGGTTSGAGNVIAANYGSGADGVECDGSTVTGNLIQGNFIGTDATGTRPLGNGNSGVLIEDSPGNTVGGTVAGAGNVISANAVMGLTIFGSNATGNLVEGNRIGTDVGGVVSLGNGGPGVLITDRGDGVGNIGGASQNTIGGAAPGAGNTIAYNTGAGVRVLAGVGDLIQGNSFFANTALGIDLGPVGVTPNDHDDPDTGPNGLQNYPVLHAATVNGSAVTVKGKLHSTPNTTFTLDFYASPAPDPSGFGQGALYLGALTVTTSPGGNASFSAGFTAAVPVGLYLTATATDPAGSTSEFSAAVFAGVAGVTVTPTSPPVTTEAGGTATFTVQLSSAPIADVTIPLSSSDPAQGLPSVSALTFTALNWNVPQTVTVTGQDDHLVNGDQSYRIDVGAGQSADPVYNGRFATAVALTNLERDVAPPPSPPVSPPVPLPVPPSALPAAGSPGSTTPAAPGAPGLPAPAAGGGTAAVSVSQPPAAALPAGGQADLTAGAASVSAGTVNPLPGAAGLTPASDRGTEVTAATDLRLLVVTLNAPTVASPGDPTAPGGVANAAFAVSPSTPVSAANHRDTTPPNADVSLLMAASVPSDPRNTQGFALLPSEAPRTSAAAPTSGQVFFIAAEVRAAVGAAPRSAGSPAASPGLLPELPRNDSVAFPGPEDPAARTPARGGVAGGLGELPWRALDRLGEEGGADDAPAAPAAFALTGAIAGAGYVLLNTRATAWLLSLLAAKPLWRGFDPLEVLFAWEKKPRREGDNAEEETLLSLVK